MTIAPAPQFPEQSPTSYDRKMGNNTARKGVLRFQEGTVTDTDVPNDFGRGGSEGTAAPGVPNHNNPEVQFKHAADTQRERAHLGSASWIEAPSVLNEFVSGTDAGNGPPQYERVFNPGTRQERQSPTVISN